MKTKIILTLSLLSSLSIFSQVGIGTTTPDATLHIKGTTIVGGSGTSTLLSDGFEDNTLSPFTTSGDELWELTTNASEVNSGLISARTKDALIDNESSTLEYTTNITTTGTISFAVTTSTESFDKLTFYIDGIFQQDFAGSTSYTTVSFPLSAGAHTLTWTYEKDSSLSIGDDRVAIDDVLITETTTGGSNAYTFRLEDGQQQAGYVLTSDADGYATWLAPSGGGGSGTDDQNIENLSLSGTTLTVGIENGTSDTVNLSSLQDGTGTDNQTIENFSLSGNILSLSIEDDGIATQTVDLSSLSGSGSYSFENGISESGNTVRLGGDLTQDTYIDLDSNYDLIVDNGTKKLISILNDEDFVTFGNSTASPDTDFDNRSFNIGSSSYTAEVVLAYHKGASGGSAFKLGSVEYIVDGGAELFLDGASALSPFYNTFSFADLGTTDNITTYNGGTNTGEWEDIYVQNAVTVSDKRSKDNIKEISYGLDEILKLRPVSFDYKKQIKNQRKYKAASGLFKQKLGFIAQDVEKILPEVVKTHDWKVTDETNKTVEYLENNLYGIMYTDIVPVTVKAIQEQQEQIELLKEAIVELKKQNESLKMLIESKQ